VAKVRVVYFLEDRAQEGFLRALVERVAREEGLPVHALVHDVRSARHGSKAIGEFRRFLVDLRRDRESLPDLLVVAVDGNCKGYGERATQLRRMLQPTDPFGDRVVFAIPDPHIERWYLMDQRALKEATGLERAPEMPPYKCKRSAYKQVLRDALSRPPVHSLLGGVEFAEEIVERMRDLESLRAADASFARLIADLRSALRSLRRAPSPPSDSSATMGA